MIPTMTSGEDDELKATLPEGVTDKGIHDWLEGHIDITALCDLYAEELKTAGCTNGKPEKVKNTEDGPPDDIRAFYGHPLTAATTSVNEEDKHASAVALLHEYINLPALDKSGMKIGDKINSIYDIMRDDGSSTKAEHDNNMIAHNGDVGEYIELLQTTLASEVDKFFNSDSGEATQATLQVVEDNVSLAGEVIQEICVQTSNEEELFTTISDTNILTNGIEPVIHTESAQSESTLNMAVPVTVADYPTDLSRRNSDMRDAVSRDGDKSPVLQDISQHKPSKGRQKLEQKQQTQEISRKLVKALSEKILKRQLSQQAEQGAQSLQKGNEHNNETRLTAPATTSCAVLNGIPSNSVAERSSYSCHPGNYESQTCEIPSELRNHHVNISESAEVKEVSTGSKETLASCKTMIPESTSLAPPLTVSSHIQSYAPPHTHEQVPVAPEKVQYINGPVPIQCIPNVHGTAAENSNDPVKFQQYLANCGSVPLSNQNNHVVNSAANATTSVPTHDYYHNYPYVYQLTPSSDTSVDRDILLERYLQQQNAYFQEQTNVHYQGHQVKENYGMKSPDSGYNEATVSPHDQSQVQTYKEPEAVAGTKTIPKGEKVGRRRRSAPPMYVKQYWNAVDKNLTPLIPKLEVDPTGYKYYLEAPISTTQRIEEDRITYVNKGQYYGLTLENFGDRQLKSSTIKSVIMVVFREDKHLDDENKAWEFWHSRQHSYKQRVLDIDTKNSVGVGPSNVDEISHNAVAVRWNPRNSPVKVNIAVHCLSTDFSNQKGVKGLPLHVQIDTFENVKDTLPVSRAYCQIKVFCDKGAERKTRDEEKRKNTKLKVESQAKARKRHEEVYHSAIERSEFYAMADLTTQPVLFSPTYEGEETVTRVTVSPVNLTNDEDGSSSITSSGEEGYYSSAKRSRTDSYTPTQACPNILLYVREKHESVFTALMLRTPTLRGLMLAVEEKYKIPVLKIKNAYKRSKKGILVRLDDNIIRHYSHEATFVIELNCVSEDKDYEIILTEIEVN